jgi:polyferredoxin
VERDRGSLARIAAGGKIENVYRLQIMNATESLQQVEIKADGLPGIAVSSDGVVSVEATQSRWVAVRVQVPFEGAVPGSYPIEFKVESQDGLAKVTEKSVFIVPR